MSAISIVMPVFNAEQWLPETLASVARQTNRDWELIAVDDGSTDDSAAVLRAFANQHPGHVTVLSQPHQGRSSARNTGIELARGDLIALLDADDVWAEDKLAVQVSWLADHPECIACTCTFTNVPRPSERSFRTLAFDWSQDTLLRWALLEGFGPGLCSTLVIRREALQQSGGFTVGLDVGEDVDLALRLIDIGRIGNVDEVLMRYVPSRGRRTDRKVDPPRVDHLEHLERLEPFASSPRLRRRLRSNGETFAAMHALRAGKVSVGLRHGFTALTVSPLGSARYLTRTVLRKLPRR